MNRFSLSRENALPEACMAEGRAFSVYSDFRRILRILRLLNDPEVLDADKHTLFLKLFFKDEIPPEPYKAFAWFVNCGEEREGGEKDFDFEQDAREIYAGFMQIYGIDLMETEMHWWKFSMLLDGLFGGETALGSKVQLRHMDDSKAKRKTDLSRAKRNAAIGRSISRADAALENRLRERLQAGLPINDLLGGIKHG